MADDEISEAGRKARFAQWDKLGLDEIEQDLATGGHRLIGGPPQVRALAREFVRLRKAEAAEATEGKALIEKALKLGVPIDDLLTADGEGVAWTTMKDFKATINEVLVEFRKGDPIRDWPLLNELRNGRRPVASLKSELWRRVMTAQAANAAEEKAVEEKPTELLTLNPNFHGFGINLKEAGRRIRRRFKKS